MYRKQDWTPDWDDGSGRLKVVSSPQAENASFQIFAVTTT